MNEDDLAHLIRSTFPEGKVPKKPRIDSMVKRWTSNQEMEYTIGTTVYPKKYRCIVS